MPPAVEPRDLPFLALHLGVRDAIARADRFGPDEAFVTLLRAVYREHGIPRGPAGHIPAGDIGSPYQVMRLHEQGVIRLTLNRGGQSHLKLTRATVKAVRAAVRQGKAGREDAGAWRAYRLARRFFKDKMKG